MAQRTWQGGATAKAQVWTTAIASSTNGQTFGVTLTDEVGGTGTVSYTASSDTTTTIATNLAAAINASTDPRFIAVTASSALAVLTLTADTAGVPFYPATTGTGSFSATSTTTANQGPNDWNTKSNWVENVLPVNGDNIILSGSNTISYGLITGLALGAFNSLSTFSGAIGVQGEYLSFTCTSFAWSSTGLGFVNIGSSAIAPVVFNTNSASAPASGLYLLGSAMTTLTVYNGAVDIAGSTGQTSSVTTFNVSGINNGRPRVNLGTGVTSTTLGIDSGTANIACSLTTVNANGGTVTTYGSGTIGTINIRGATVVSNSTGTITTANVIGGSIDFTQLPTARTVSNCTISTGRAASVLADTSLITFSAGIIIGAGITTISAA